MLTYLCIPFSRFPSPHKIWMPDGILPVALACHDMKVSEVKLESVIDTMILVSLKDRGGKGGRLQRWYINFGNWVNQIDVAYFVDCAGSRQDSVS